MSNKIRKHQYTWISIVIGIILLWGFSYYLINKIVDKWEDVGTFGDSFGAVNALFSGLAFAGISYSIFIQIKAVQADHDRRKKETTINYVSKLNPIYNELLREYKKGFGSDPINEKMLNEIVSKEKKEGLYHLRDFLMAIENLCIGANNGVFDKFILYKMLHNFLIKNHHRFSPYIKYMQNTYNTPSYYCEYDKLIGEFITAKEKYNGDIDMDKDFFK